MDSQRVGLGPRAAAFLLDILAVVLIGFFFGFAITWLMDQFHILRFSIDTNAAAWAVIIFHLWFTAIVYSILEGLAGASLGKILLGLTVGRADGQKAGLGRKLLRWLLKGLTLLFVPCFGLIENVFVIYPFLALSLISILGLSLVLGKEKQTLYDRLAGTAVFRRRRPSSNT